MLVQNFIAKCTASNKCNGEIVRVLQFTAGTTPDEKDQYLGPRTEETKGRFKREDVDIAHYLIDAGSKGSTYSEYHLPYLDPNFTKDELVKFAKAEGFSIDDGSTKAKITKSIEAQLEAKHLPILDWENRARLEYSPDKEKYQKVHAWPGLPPNYISPA